MLITPRPGVNLDNLIQNFRSISSAATNVFGGSGSTAQVYVLQYLDWAGQAARILGYQISEKDLASLVLTRRYEMLASSFGTMNSPLVEAQRVVRDLVRLEVGERIKDIDEAIKTLKAYKDRWTNVGELVVLDTNFYCVHPTELKDTDLARLTTAITPGWAMHVLVPMLVVDELDRLKKDSQARTRARTTLRMLNQVFARVSADRPMDVLRAADDAPRPDQSIGLGPITMELLFDPPGHTRLPDPDDEIVDRAVAVQSLAGRDVTMVTYDGGMSFRARYAGLKEMCLPYPEQDEAQGRSRRGRGDGRPERSADAGAEQ
jgi:PIN domain